MDMKHTFIALLAGLMCLTAYGQEPDSSATSLHTIREAMAE